MLRAYKDSKRTLKEIDIVAVFCCMDPYTEHIGLKGSSLYIAQVK